jgi:hypothetical protein
VIPDEHCSHVLRRGGAAARASISHKAVVGDNARNPAHAVTSRSSARCERTRYKHGAMMQWWAMAVASSTSLGGGGRGGGGGGQT